MSRMIYLIEILTVTAISVQRNMGNIQIKGKIFVAYIGADYNKWL